MLMNHEEDLKKQVIVSDEPLRRSHHAWKSDISAGYVVYRRPILILVLLNPRTFDEVISCPQSSN